MQRRKIYCITIPYLLRNSIMQKIMQALKKDALEEKVYSKVVLKKVLIISKECLKQKYLLKRWAIARSKGSKVPH